MEGIGIQSLVKLKNSNIEGQVKIMECLNQNYPLQPTHVYITLNNNATHPDARFYNVSHQFSAMLLKCAIDDIETRQPSSPKDIYKLIDENNLEAIKLLSQRGLEKKPTVNAQKDWLTSMNYALMFGTKEIITYMLDKGLKPFVDTKGRSNSSTRDYGTVFDLLLLSTNIETYEDLKELWERFEKEYTDKSINENSRIWGPMGYHRWRTKHKQNINDVIKLQILHEKHGYMGDKPKEDMLRAFMYNGRIELAKYMIEKWNTNPEKAFASISGGDNCFTHCKEQLIKAGSSLEELYSLYKNG